MNLKMRWLLPPVMVCLVLATLARPDTLTLKDGRVIQGSFYRQGDHYVIEPAGSPAFQVPLNDLVAVELKTPENSPQYAERQWQFLLLRIGRERHLPAIITELKTYLKTYPHAAACAEAQLALTRYQHYQAAGFVNFAGSWISPKTRSALLKQCRLLTDQAQSLLRQGNLIQAEQACGRVVKIDPAYQPGLLILGVTEYHLGKLQEAAADFAKVLAKNPHDVPALNDLAIVLYHQNLEPAALVHYSQALVLAGDNRLLLDNIYSALHAYKSPRRVTVYRRLKAAFKFADRQMQVKMAALGLYRFGNRWVDAKTHAQLQHRWQAYVQQKNVLQARYDAARVSLNTVTVQLAQVNQQIAYLNNAIDLLELNQNGLIIGVGDPPPDPQNSGGDQPLHGVNPQQPGVNPQSPGINPQKPGVNPQSPGVNPQPSGINPQISGVNPQVNVMLQNGGQPANTQAPNPTQSPEGDLDHHRHHHHHHHFGLGIYGAGLIDSDAAALAQAQERQWQLQAAQIQLQGEIKNLRIAADQLVRNSPAAAFADIQQMMLPDGAS